MAGKLTNKNKNESKANKRLGFKSSRKSESVVRLCGGWLGFGVISVASFEALLYGKKVKAFFFAFIGEILKKMH